MSEKNIILGVTGSIAAYKAADLASTLTQKGIVVHVVMTPEALHFVTSLTFSAITHQPVITTLWDEEKNKNRIPTHIAIADRADLAVVAPATAHIIAQMACGLAGDVLSTTLLAVQCPLLVAPAMNGKMWKHPATQENIKALKKRGVEFIGPEKGMLSCSYEGEGRLCAIEKIAGRILKILKI